jgi:hypothetical protein
MKSVNPVFDKKLIMFLALIIFLDIAMVRLGPHKSLDVKLYYSGDQARGLLQSFDGIELQKYFINEIFDLILIFAYSCAFFVGIQRAFPNYKNLALLGLIPGAFDLFETIAIIYALRTSGPNNFFDWLGVVTFLKWITGVVALTAFVLGVVKKFTAMPKT